MNRRTVIKNLALAIGGAVLLPSCLRSDGTSYYQLKHIQLDGDHQKLIAEMCETIIPKTDVPGAMDLNLHVFVLKMLDDCYKKKDQLAIKQGMDEFSAMVQKKYNQAFSDLAVKDREAVLTGIESSHKPKAGAKTPARSFRPQRNLEVPPLEAFYSAIKQQTIFAYTTSQFFMTKEIVYELVPGRYNAHFPVKNLKTA
jgi:hypothetical protein